MMHDIECTSPLFTEDVPPSVYFGMALMMRQASLYRAAGVVFVFFVLFFVIALSLSLGPQHSNPFA